MMVLLVALILGGHRIIHRALIVHQDRALIVCIEIALVMTILHTTVLTIVMRLIHHWRIACLSNVVGKVIHRIAIIGLKVAALLIVGVRVA